MDEGKTHPFQTEELVAHSELDIILMDVEEGMQAGAEVLSGAANGAWTELNMGGENRKRKGNQESKSRRVLSAIIYTYNSS